MFAFRAGWLRSGIEMKSWSVEQQAHMHVMRCGVLDERRGEVRTIKTSSWSESRRRGERVRLASQ